MFKTNNKDTIDDVTDQILVPLLLTLNMIHFFF